MVHESIVSLEQAYIFHKIWNFSMKYDLADDVLQKIPSVTK